MIGPHRLFATLFVAALLAVGARAEGFVPGLDDLPLMDGLAEVAGSGTVFDQPAGRIVDAYAVGRVDADAVARFYGDTLPHLGWTPVDAMTFTREGERLAISVTRSGGDLTVHFSLTPD